MSWPESAPPASPPKVDLPLPLPGPRLIEVRLLFTPDQFAVWDQAEHLVRDAAGKRMPREEVALEMARARVAASPSRTRARHQVVLHVDGESGEGWYETDRGTLPASPEKVEEMLRQAEVTVCRKPDLVLDQVGPNEPALAVGPAPNQQVDLDMRTLAKQSSPGKQRRPDIPVATLRALFVRAGGCCEVEGCERRDRLQVHHVVAWSEGGTHDLNFLELRCPACHSLGHEKDFEREPG